MQTAKEKLVEAVKAVEDGELKKAQAEEKHREVSIKLRGAKTAAQQQAVKQSGAVDNEFAAWQLGGNAFNFLKVHATGLDPQQQMILTAASEIIMMQKQNFSSAVSAAPPMHPTQQHQQMQQPLF